MGGGGGGKHGLDLFGFILNQESNTHYEFGKSSQPIKVLYQINPNHYTMVRFRFQTVYLNTELSFL